MFLSKKVWLVPLVLSAVLIAIAQFDFLTFHTLAELFAIMIAFMMFALAVNTIQFTKDYLFLFLACGYFWIASMDLLHTMAYPNMNLIVEGSTNMATQFWIATRGMEAFLLLFGAMLVHSMANAKRLFLLYGVLSVVFSALIVMGNFPVTYIEGFGLTQFKIQSEHLIIILLGVSLYLYSSKVKLASDATKQYLIASILLSIGAEFAFTAYVEFYDIFNLIGHILKVCSFWMLYQALIASTMISPHLKAHTMHEAILQSPLGMGIVKLNGEYELRNDAYKFLMGKDHFNLITEGRHEDITKFTSWLETDEVMECLEKGKVWRGKMELGDGKVDHVNKVIISPVLDYEGRMNAALIIISDITGITQAKSLVADKGSAISDILVGSITAIAELLETRDPYTSGHSEKVSAIAVEIGKELNLNVEELEGVRIAGLIHDIGKIKVPMEILNKPGDISKAEFDIIKEHPKIGYSVIKNIPFPWNVPDIVLSHHEKWEGGGYPDGLVGDAIPFGARILAVADVIEAITSHRPYRPALGIDKAFEVLDECSGKQFDPVVVNAAMRIRSIIAQKLGV
ncbi:MAG: HD domain-containing protein [Sphingomonadales bacterium]|nr:HD domain-containing protein [Sphingomonadales bacterium]